MTTKTMGIPPDKSSILIIDDKPGKLILLTEILAEAGYDIQQVKSGERALKMAAINPPDLILLDIKMPGMDGYEVCRQLKDREDLKDIPVIFLTALSDSIDKVRAFAVGGVDYVVKPFDPDEVLARVKTHLDIWFRRSSLEQENRMLRESGLAAISGVSHARVSAMDLTDREKECLMWLARGLRNDRIAEKMGIQIDTVQLHIGKARKRLSAATREQALAIALQVGAVKP